MVLLSVSDDSTEPLAEEDEAKLFFFERREPNDTTEILSDV